MERIYLPFWKLLCGNENIKDKDIGRDLVIYWHRWQFLKNWETLIMTLRVSDLDSVRNSCYVSFWKATSLSSSLRQWAWKDPEGCFVLRNRANQFTPSDPSQSEVGNLRSSNTRFKRKSQLFVQHLADKEKEKIRDVEPQTNLAHTLAWNGDPCYWFRIWLWGSFQNPIITHRLIKFKDAQR